MVEEKDLVERIQEAKDIIGDDAIPIIAEHLGITVEDGRASCPFHQDDTPSFIWNPKLKYFKCFSCSRVYSILDYFVDITGSTKEAINELFKMAHMEYDTYSYKPFEGDRIDWFKDYKYPHPEKEPTEDNVIKYLGYRGISRDTIEYAGVKEDEHGNIAFEYRDLDNELLAVKYKPSRKVKNGEPKMWFQKDASTVPILWNVKKLDFTKPLVISEGEIDALSIIESGYNNVCSIPNGAGSISWIEFNFDFLENFNSIVLWYDNDKAGEEGLKKTASRLGEYKCKIVKPKTDDEDKVEEYYSSHGRMGIRKTDANNILIACGKERIIDLINRAEEVPVKNLKYLMDCENQDLKDIEKTSTGLDGLDKILYGNLKGCLTIYTGLAGCVDCDTEYFNGTEWKRIADYVDGDKVLQYNEDGTATLVDPIQYHKYPVDYLWHFKTRYGLDQCLSDEHQVYYITSKNNLYHKSFKEVRENHEHAVCGFKGKFITSFNYSGDGVELSDAEIKLMCAIICDGNFMYDGKTDRDYSNRPSNDICRITVKKERKKKRLREILNECNIEWKETELKREGYTTFAMKAPRHEKEFSKYWYNCNHHQLQVICDNVLFWDGCTKHGQKTFSTSIKESADFIQFAFSSCGYKARICTYDTRGQVQYTNSKKYIRKSMTYIVSITKKNNPTITSGRGKEKPKIEKYKTHDGFKYCFTVPSHMWVMRRKDCIVITGNSGKSSLCNLTSVIAPIEAGKKVFIFSGELSEGQLLNWIMSPLAGINNTVVWDNDGGRKGFSVTTEADMAIRQYYHDDIILYSDVNELETNEDSLLQAMEIAYRKYNCEYFLIDNLMSISFDNTSDSIYENQKKYFIKLMNFVNQYQVTVSCIVHPRKSQNGDNKLDVYSLNGSSNLSNLCHRLIAVSRIHDDEEGYSMEVEIIKDRPSQAAGQTCKLMYDYCTRRIYSTNDELKHEFNWELNFNHNYSGRVKDNLIVNRRDVLDTIPKVNTFNPDTDCDQY